MSLKKNALSVIFAVLVLTLALTASAQENIALRYTLWVAADSPQVALFNEMAAEYTALHPNVTVTFESIPFPDYQSDVTLQLAGNNPPDMGWIVEGAAKSWVKSGVLADLSPALKGSEDYNFADFSEASLGLWTEGDAVYGIPFSTSPFIVLYNADLFEAAGIPTPAELIAEDNWTWETLASSAKAITDATDAYGLQSVDAALYTGNFWATIVPILRGFGGDAWTDDNVCAFNTPESVAGLQYIHDMVFTDESLVPPGTEVDFFAGGAAMTLGQLSRVNRLADAAFVWSIAPLPKGANGDQPVVGQAAMVVFNNGANRDAAIDFLAFLTSEENVARLAAFFPPARQSVLASDVLAESNPLVPADLMQSTVIDQIQNGRVMPTSSQFPRIELVVRPLLDELWVADADVQAIADNICASIDPLLAR